MEVLEIKVHKPSITIYGSVSLYVARPAPRNWLEIIMG